MALIDEQSRCTLCGELLGDPDNWIATTMIGLRPPLSRMDDSAAHNRCLRDWQHKEAFVEAYNAGERHPELCLDEDGFVRHVRPDRPLIAWYEWLAMPLLLPLCAAYHAIDAVARLLKGRSS